MGGCVFELKVIILIIIFISTYGCSQVTVDEEASG